MQVAVRLHNPSESAQGDLEWVSEFFNSRNLENFRLPAAIIQEMVAAGFKKYTVLHMMCAYTDKMELSNYLATTLRVTHVERDIIAGLIMERKARFLPTLKQENCDY